MGERIPGVCQNCRWWAGDRFVRLAACHRNPPTIAGADLRAYWPNTVPYDWCGEFEDHPDAD